MRRCDKLVDTGRRAFFARTAAVAAGAAATAAIPSVTTRAAPSLALPCLLRGSMRRSTSASLEFAPSPTPSRRDYRSNETGPRKRSGFSRNYSNGIDARTRSTGGSTSASTT